MQESIGCKKCIIHSNKNNDDENLNYVNNLDIEDIFIEDEIIKINNLKLDEIVNYKFRNINIYDLVLYDYFIVFKKDKLYKLEREEIKFIKNQIINNIKAISIIEKILPKFKIRNIFMIDEYSFQSSIRAWCKLNKIKVFFFNILTVQKKFSNLQMWIVGH